MTATYPGEIDTVQLLIQVGNGASPEVFAMPCLINTSRSYKKTANVKATEIPRCDDPLQIGKTVRTATSTDSTIAGAGILDQALVKAYNDMVGVTKNIKVQVGSVTGNLVVTGPYILTSFEVLGQNKGEPATVALQWDQADDPTATAHA